VPSSLMMTLGVISQRYQESDQLPEKQSDQIIPPCLNTKK
jgi:hypothetical protein